MDARIGDMIVVESERMGQPAREGEILEVIEASYGTRFRVRWDDGRESTIRPAAGSARVVSTARLPAAKTRRAPRAPTR